METSRSVPNRTLTRTHQALEHIDASAMDYAVFSSEETARLLSSHGARLCVQVLVLLIARIAGAHEIMSVPALKRSLDHLRQTGTTHLFFIDDTFNVPVKPFRELCRLMIQKKYGPRHCKSTRLRCLTSLAGERGRQIHSIPAWT